MKSALHKLFAEVKKTDKNSHSASNNETSCHNIAHKIFCREQIIWNAQDGGDSAGEQTVINSESGIQNFGRHLGYIGMVVALVGILNILEILNTNFEINL